MDILKKATNGKIEPPENWMTATDTRPFMKEDPVLVWLEEYGDQYGYKPVNPDYSFRNFIASRGYDFEQAWKSCILDDVPTVCNDQSVNNVAALEKTYEYMQADKPVIAEPALWWAPGNIYGVPDFIAKANWFNNKFGVNVSGDNYIVADLKYTTKIDSSRKKRKREEYKAQLSFYKHALNKIQGGGKDFGFLFTRDHITSPYRLALSKSLEQYKDMIDQYQTIIKNGDKLNPREDRVVDYKLSNQSEKWGEAKEILAKGGYNNRYGYDVRLLPRISRDQKDVLAEHGIDTVSELAATIANDNFDITQISGIGGATSTKIKSILQAHRTEEPVYPNNDAVPDKKEYEFHVDYEYCTNVNLTYDDMKERIKNGQDVIGQEMIAKIGVRDSIEGKANFSVFEAKSESQKEERRIINDFINYIDNRTNGCYQNSHKTAIYHYSFAEKTQTTRAANRLDLPENHGFRHLPFVDIKKIITDEQPVAFPDVFSYGLKGIAKALGKHDKRYDPNWPTDLQSGMEAMVMIWQLWEADDPLNTYENNVVNNYLEADVRALDHILTWCREVTNNG